MTAFGATTAFGWMMFFGFGTMIVHSAYYTFIREWPPTEPQHIDLPTGIVLFILLYGIPSLISGACIGWLAALVIEFLTINNAGNA